jgi:ABC-type transport system substrate-binding protein
MSASKKKTVIAILVASLLAGAFLLTGCGSAGTGGDAKTSGGAKTDDADADVANEAPADDEPKYGGTLNAWKQEFMNDLDPATDSRTNQENLWYETLWIMDWGLDDPENHAFTTSYLSADEMRGQIAESWEADYDAGTLTVKIRDDIKFQNKDPYNGRQLVAEDVKWTYDRLLGIGSGYTAPMETSGADWLSQLYMIESIEASDDVTVVFHLKPENSNETSVNDLIVSEINIAGHEWDELSDEQKKDWHYAAGTGPYILEEYVLDNYMRFVKNEDYYGYDERHPENKLPYADEIVLQVVSESANRLTQFTAGQLDFMSGTNPLNRSELAQLEASMDKSEYWELKKYSGPVAVGLKQTVELFKDIRVRKALQMAINTEEISKDYYKIEGDPEIMGLFHSRTALSDVDNWEEELYASYATYDPEAAKKLLAEAGYPDGFEFTVTIFGALDADLFTLAATYLSEIGVTMNIEVAGNPMEMESIGFDKGDERVIFKNAGFPDMGRVQMNLLSTSPFDAIFHDDKTFDDLFNKSVTAPTMAERIKYAKEADRYFAEQHWILCIGGGEEMTDIFSTRVGGYRGEQWFRVAYPRVWLTR